MGIFVGIYALLVRLLYIVCSHHLPIVLISATSCNRIQNNKDMCYNVTSFTPSVSCNFPFLENCIVGIVFNNGKYS